MHQTLKKYPKRHLRQLFDYFIDIFRNYCNDIMTEKPHKQQLTSAVSLIREGKLSFYAVNQNFKL